MKTKILLLWVTICVSLYSCSNKDSNLLLPMVVDGLYGYIDEPGKVVIEPQFKYAGIFSDGLACVKTHEGYGYINKRGKMVIAPIFDNAGDFSDGCAVVQLDQKDYFINNRFSGKQDLITVGFSWTRGFSEGLAAVEINGKWGYVNTNGEMVISPEYYEACSFKDGLARVKTSDSDLDGWTYINKSGSEITDLPLSGNSEDFSDGLAKIVLYNKNTGGSWCTFIDREGAAFKNKYKSAQNFTEGLAAVKTDEGWGYVDKHENFIIPPTKRFRQAYEFSEGLAAVEIDHGPLESEGNKYGYIDKIGDLLISPEFEGAGEFSNGVAIISDSDRNMGLINRNGKVILDAKYSYIWILSDEWVKIDQEKWTSDGECHISCGLAKTNGDIIVKPEYPLIGYLHDKYFIILDNNNNSAYMDVYGNWIWAAPSFDTKAGAAY